MSSSIRKNGMGKKGFVRVSNEDNVMMNDSGSEVELLDVTEMNSISGRKLSRNKRQSNDGCCCNCCISFYLLLMTLLMAVLTIFALYLAYDLKLTKHKIEEMNDQMDNINTEYLSLKSYCESHVKNHSSLLWAQSQELSQHGSSISTMQGEEKHHEEQLKQLLVILQNRTKEITAIKHATSQLDTNQMQRVNASMKSVAMFSSEVSSIHTSMAQLGSKMDGLANEVTSTKKYCSDFGTNIEKLTETVADMKDSVTVIKSNGKEREEMVDTELSTLSNMITNHSKLLSTLEENFNQSLISYLKTRAESTRTTVIKLKSDLNELHLSLTNIMGKVNNLTNESPSVNIQLPTAPSDEGSNESQNNVSENTESHDNTGSNNNAGSNDTGDKPKVDGGAKQNTGSDGFDDGDTGSDGSNANTGSDNDNTGSDVSNTGSVHNNAGSDDGNTGSDDDNTGSDDGNTGSDDNTGSDVSTGSNNTVSIDNTDSNDNTGSHNITGPDDNTNSNTVNTTNQAVSDSGSSDINRTTPDTTSATEPIPQDTNPPPVTINSNNTDVDSTHISTPSSSSDELSPGSTSPPELATPPYHNTNETGSVDQEYDYNNDVDGESPEEEEGRDHSSHQLMALNQFLEMFDKIDTNRNGYISSEEFGELFPGYENVFNFIDKDINGAISKAEIYSAIDSLSNTNGDNDKDKTTPPIYD